MTDFDVIVVGGGTGNNVAAAAADAGLQTALVEPGPLGGTCLNRGCNPSKMLIQRANVANSIREADRFGIDAEIQGIDFAGFVDEIETTLSDIAEGMESRYREKEHLTMFPETTRFVDERTVELNGSDVSGEKVVVAAGTRPIVPPIEGIEDVEYLTSDDAIYLDERPESLVILGGGYIAVELGYFFEAMGTDVTIVEMMDTLLPREDPEVAEAFTEIASRRHEVYTGYRATAVSEDGDGVVVTAESGDDEVSVAADEVLVALGRRPNSDTLDLESTGIETDENDFVETNEYLETTAEAVWAQGDIAGNFLFKHTGDYETGFVVDNAVHGERRAIDYTAMPHAIFTEPQIAGVGPTEDELQEAGREYVVGKANFADSSMGRAKKLEDGFAKVLASADGEVLGCHVIGHEASILVHEAVVPMRQGNAHVSDIAGTVHVHPALSKVMKSAFGDVPV